MIGMYGWRNIIDVSSEAAKRALAMDYIKGVLFGEDKETLHACALVHRSNGPFITAISVKTPAGEHDIVVNVKAISLNPVDYKMATSMISYALGEKLVGYDFSGIVIWSGDKSAYRVGDKVFGMGQVSPFVGTASSYLVLDTRAIAIATIPDGTTFEEAAAVPLVFGTAYDCLSTAKLGPGARVLVLGGATASGQMTIQLAKHHFNTSYVLATCSSSSKELVMKLGADETIDYRQVADLGLAISEKSRGNGKFNIVVDLIGGREVLNHIDEILLPKREGSTYATVVGDTAAVSEKGYSGLGGIAALFTDPRMMFRMLWGPINYKLVLVSKGKWIDLLQDMLASKSLTIVIDSVYPLANWRDAWDKLGSGRARGKIVLQLDRTGN
jgi:NADPH:quinone reductase-like Zn-dependent oxidoreductase